MLNYKLTNFAGLPDSEVNKLNLFTIFTNEENSIILSDIKIKNYKSASK